MSSSARGSRARSLVRRETTSYHLAAVSSFKKDGRWWWQSQMSEFVQAIATVDGLVVEFTRTPEYRQTGNQQWNP